MTVALKCCCGLFVALMTIIPDSSCASYAIAAAFCILIFKRTGIGLYTVVKANLFILVFTVFFTVITILSEIIEGTVVLPDPFLTSADILLIFNIVYSLKLWLGRSGIGIFINSFPSMRLKVYSVLLMKTIAALYRSVPDIINHVRSRVELNLQNRWNIARYYVQNVITKELFILHHLQASVYMRLSDDIVLWNENESMSMVDWAAVAIACTAIVFMLVFQMKVIP